MSEANTKLATVCPLPWSGAACFFVSAVMACTAGGCFLPLPLGAIPAPLEGSGKKLSFCSADGAHINKDGFLVVVWDETVFGGEPHLTRQLVRIRDGYTSLPEKWTLASLWVEWFYGSPLHPYVTIKPSSGVAIYPLLEGQCQNWMLGRHDIQGGEVMLDDSRENPVGAMGAWLWARDELLKAEHALPKREYSACLELIEQERARMKTAENDATSEPATRPCLR
jgi:hypothetical protein